MLPQPVKPEKGSRKIINGKEFWTRHVFTTEIGNVMDTVDGEFILPNGEPARDKTILELLPSQHKDRALAWWEKNFGGNSRVLTGTGLAEKGPTTQDLLGTIEDLRREVAVLTARLNAEKDYPEPSENQEEGLSASTGSEKTKVVANPQKGGKVGARKVVAGAEEVLEKLNSTGT